jgi:hypothetical protein
MINIFSIRSSLAFAPYLAEAMSEFLREKIVTSRVLRQGGSGLIIRSDGPIILRYQNRQEELGSDEADHYRSTVRFREKHFQVSRMEDEVVIASVGSELLLSHPQSELWLTEQAVAALLQRFKGISASGETSGLPEWLSVSASAGRLLLSDQRSGRWVLLGDDHMHELEQRMPRLQRGNPTPDPQRPPTISLKGVTVHLQSAATLADTLDEFATTGRFQPFSDCAPGFSLSVKETTEGIEVADAYSRVGLTAKESRKWVEIIRSELARLNSNSVTRGRIKTVFADAETGRWVLQWGDEVLVPNTLERAHLRTQISQSKSKDHCLSETLKIREGDNFLLVLEHATGSCVALDENELNRLFNAA